MTRLKQRSRITRMFFAMCSRRYRLCTCFIIIWMISSTKVHLEIPSSDGGFKYLLVLNWHLTSIYIKCFYHEFVQSMKHFNQFMTRTNFFSNFVNPLWYVAFLNNIFHLPNFLIGSFIKCYVFQQHAFSIITYVFFFYLVNKSIHRTAYAKYSRNVYWNSKPFDEISTASPKYVCLAWNPIIILEIVDLLPEGVDRERCECRSTFGLHL